MTGTQIFLSALLLAVFPANINMAVNHIHLGSPMLEQYPALLWGRLPVQLLLLAMVYGGGLWEPADDDS